MRASTRTRSKLTHSSSSVPRPVLEPARIAPRTSEVTSVAAMSMFASLPSCRKCRSTAMPSMPMMSAPVAPSVRSTISASACLNIKVTAPPLLLALLLLRRRRRRRGLLRRGGRVLLLLLLLLRRRRGVGRGVPERDGLRYLHGARARGGLGLDAAALVVGAVDARRDEEEYLVRAARDELAAEEVSEDGQRAEARRAVLRLGLAVVDDAAHDRGAAVGHEHFRRHALRVDAGSAERVHRAVDVVVLHRDLKYDRARVRYLRRDREAERDGDEDRREERGAAARAYLRGDDGYLRARLDLRGPVVERRDAGRGDDLRLTLRLCGGDERAYLRRADEAGRETYDGRRVVRAEADRGVLYVVRDAEGAEAGADERGAGAGRAGRLADAHRAAAARKRERAQLEAEVAREVAVGEHDARLDLDLRLGLVEQLDEAAYGVDVLLNVGDDERVRAAVDLHSAAAREPALNDGQDAL